MGMLKGGFFDQRVELYWDPPYYHRWASLIAAVLLFLLLMLHTYRFCLAFINFKSQTRANSGIPSTRRARTSCSPSAQSTYTSSGSKPIVEFPTKGSDLYPHIVLSHTLVFIVIIGGTMLTALEWYSTSRYVLGCRYLPGFAVTWYYWSKGSLFYYFVLRYNIIVYIQYVFARNYLYITLTKLNLLAKSYTLFTSMTEI